MLGKIISMLMMIVFSFLSMGSECVEAGPIDGMLMENGEGVSMCPFTLPVRVIGNDTIISRATFYNTIEEVNGYFKPHDAFYGVIDDEMFVGYIDTTPVSRFGITLVWFGILPDSTHDGGEMGVAMSVASDREGKIISTEVVINPDIATNNNAFRNLFIHALGHTVGLAHDSKSMDKNSCMSRDTYLDCKLLDSDIQLVMNCYDT